MFHTNLWVSSHQQERPSGGYFTCRKQGSNPHKDNLLPSPTPLPEVQVLSEATPSSEVGSSPTTPRQVHQFHDGVPTTSSLGPPGRSWKEEIILLIQRKQMFQFGHLGKASCILPPGKSFLHFPTWERFPAIAHLGKVCIQPYSLLTYLPVCHTRFHIRRPEDQRTRGPED